MISPRTKRGVALSGSAAVLLIGVVLIVAGGRSVQPRFGCGVHAFFPTENIGAWKFQWRPVAESEEMRRAHAELLNYDDAAFAIYNEDNVHIAIYVAYWRAGKMSHRLVATHTPDVCWVGSGWLAQSGNSVALEIGRQAPARIFAQHRVFHRGTETEHVLFGHFIGRSASYQRSPSWHAIFSDVYEWGFDQRQEQLFWRISSNRPLHEFRHSAPAGCFLERLSMYYLSPEKNGS
jgi:hypothetical protein